MNEVITVSVAHKVDYDDVEIAVFHANKGEGLPMHGHSYSHVTMCNSGSCLVTLENGKSIVMTKETQPVNLLAGVKHQLEAIEDNTVFVNVFAKGKY